MKKIDISNAPAYTSPNSMTLLCTEKPDGSTNLATLAFWAFASTNPGKIMFSLNKGAYSLELLAEKKEVILAIPGVELTSALIGCGTCSGRDTDKASKVGLTMQEVEAQTSRLLFPANCSFMRLLPRQWMRTIMLSTSAMSRVFTAMKMWMLYLAGKVTLNLRLRSRNKKRQGGCLRMVALRFEVAI